MERMRRDQDRRTITGTHRTRFDQCSPWHQKTFQTVIWPARFSGHLVTRTWWIEFWGYVLFPKESSCADWAASALSRNPVRWFLCCANRQSGSPIRSRNLFRCRQQCQPRPRPVRGLGVGELPSDGVPCSIGKSMWFARCVWAPWAHRCKGFVDGVDERVRSHPPPPKRDVSRYLNATCLPEASLISPQDFWIAATTAGGIET